MRSMLLAAVFASLTGRLAAEVAWPVDFDANVVRVVSSWQPSGAQIGVSAQTLAGSDVVPGGRAFSGGYGSEAEPFDVNWRTFGWDYLTGVFKSTPPVGFLLFLK